MDHQEFSVKGGRAVSEKKRVAAVENIKKARAAKAAKLLQNGPKINQPNKVCVLCGVGFRVKPSWFDSAKFCSQKCAKTSSRGFIPNPQPPRSFEMSIPAFWKKVDKRGADECWPWTGCRLREGYGRFKSDGKFISPHRFSYILHFGPLSEEKPCVLHKCDNPPCCNPAHLFPGTKQDNTNDCTRKGRQAWQK